MRAAAVVAGVLAQFEEFLDVQVPGLQVGADGALALAALVHGHGRVVDHLEEGHHALRLAVRALDARTQGAHARPVVAQAAGELGQQGVFLDGLIDAVQIVGHRGQVAGRQLRAQRAAVEQRGRAAHEVEGRQQLVELDGARIAVLFLQRQAHGHAHEEGLGQLDARLAHVQEVAVVQGLQAQVVELLVALGLDGGSQAGQVVVQQLGVEQLVVHALADEAGEVLCVGRLDVGRLHVAAHDLAHDRVQQQAGGDVGVVGVFFDQRASGQDGGLEDFFDRHAVVQVAQRLGDDGGGLDIGVEVAAGRLDQRQQAGLVQRHALAVVGHMQHGRRCGGSSGSGLGGLLLLGTFLVAAVAVQHVGACHVVVAAAHQAQFDLVLHIFNMEGAAARTRAQQCANHGLGQLVHGLAHAGGGRALGTAHGQEGLGQCDGDLLRREGHHIAAAADDLVAVLHGQVMGGGRIGSITVRSGSQRIQCFLHEFPQRVFVDRTDADLHWGQACWEMESMAGCTHRFHRVCTAFEH